MQKFTPNYSKHNCDVKEKSYDMQKFSPNYIVNTIVTSLAQILIQWNYVTESQ